MIDTHQHFWRLSRGGYGWMPKDNQTLYKDYEPDDLKPLLNEVGINKTIVVQADDDVAETEFLLELADEHDWIVGVVGWVDLEDPNAETEIDRLSSHPKLVGIRPMIQDIPDRRWMLKPEIAPGLHAMTDHNLTFDALVKPVHLKALETFLGLYPRLRVVVDHMAKPTFQAETFTEWSENLAALGLHENVYCKVSGLLTEAPVGASYATLLPYLDFATKSFGPERLLFGSDWPVLNLAGSYDGWIQIVKQYCLENRRADFSRLCGSNVLAAYERLPIR